MEDGCHRFRQREGGRPKRLHRVSLWRACGPLEPGAPRRRSPPVVAWSPRRTARGGPAALRRRPYRRGKFAPAGSAGESDRRPPRHNGFRSRAGSIWSRSRRFARGVAKGLRRPGAIHRSEEHTSELQSPCNLVCRLLLEKKKKKVKSVIFITTKKIQHIY